MAKLSTDERARIISEAVEAPQLTRTERLLATYRGIALPVSLNIDDALSAIVQCAQLSALTEIRIRKALPIARQHIRDFEESLGRVAKAIDQLNVPSFDLDLQEDWGVFEELFIDRSELFPISRISDTAARLKLLRGEFDPVLQMVREVRQERENSDVFIVHFIGLMSRQWLEWGAQALDASRADLVRLVATAIDDMGLRTLGPATPDSNWIDARVRAQLKASES